MQKADANINVGTDTTAFSKEMDGLEMVITEKMEKIGNVFMGALGIAAGAKSIASAFSAFTQPAAELENVATSLGVVMGNTEAAERLTGSLQRLATNGVVSFDEPLWKITDESSATRNLPWQQPVQMPLPPAFPAPALPLCVSWTLPPAWRMISTPSPMPPCRRPIPSAARVLMMPTTCRCNPARHACVARVPGWGLRGDYSGASALWIGAPPAQAVQVVMQSKLEH